MGFRALKRRRGFGKGDGRGVRCGYVLLAICGEKGMLVSFWIKESFFDSFSP